MESEKRMAGSYEVFQAVGVGPIEVVMGENHHADQGERYMCAFCESCDLFASYRDLMVSDDYVEILQLFGQRIAEEAERLHDAVTLYPALEIDDSPVVDTGFEPITDDTDLHDQVIVIKPDVLKREYQHATHQYQYCSGGFGASPHSRGSAVYCTNLFSGDRDRFERRDVLGIVPEHQLPQWAKDGLKLATQKIKDAKEAR